MKCKKKEVMLLKGGMVDTLMYTMKVYSDSDLSVSELQWFGYNTQCSQWFG